MCMRYETAAILFHEEDGDFSLWTVDMPSEIVDEARKTADLHQESLLEIMELTPTVNGPLIHAYTFCLKMKASSPYVR